jgi:hypothetical protein
MDLTSAGQTTSPILSLTTTALRDMFLKRMLSHDLTMPAEINTIAYIWTLVVIWVKRWQ